jgi:hypothetical protein
MLKAERRIARSQPAVSSADLAWEFATAGWVVEIELIIAGHAPDRRFFAVGVEDAAEAEKEVLSYPGILPQDRRVARRLLSLDEIFGMKLRTRAVRPYGWAPQASHEV